jgi:hypothetical protein
MLREANVTVLHNTRVSGVELASSVNGGGATAAAPRIAAVTTADGVTIRAAAFVDASYEGMLMKLAGVSYTWGREANTT